MTTKIKKGNKLWKTGSEGLSAAEILYGKEASADVIKGYEENNLNEVGSKIPLDYGVRNKGDDLYKFLNN